VVHDGVGFSDGSAFITVLSELLVGDRNPSPLLSSVQAPVVLVDVFYGPRHRVSSTSGLAQQG